METVQLVSSSEDDDDVYLNSVARLKALKKQMLLPSNKKKDEEKEQNRTEGLEVIEQTVATNTTVQKTRRNRHISSRLRTRKQTQARDSSEHDSDLEIVSVENKLNSSDDLIIIENDIHTDPKDDENYDISIKVLWRSKNVHRLKICRNENFRKVFEYFANLEKVSIDEILITKKDKTIKRTDTPASINLSVIDILDGGITDKDSSVFKKGTEGKINEDVRIIKVQTTDKKSLTVSVNRDENFEALWAKCAQDLNIEESKMKLYFDGELIAITDTPDSLEIEDEACFDLRLSS